MNRIVIILIFVLMPVVSWASDQTRVAYRVICEDALISEKITDAITSRINAQEELALSDEFPKAKLFVYAQQDINDRKNPNGWSFAIAHVSNIKGQYLAAKLIDSPDKGVEELKPLLVDMAREEGFLHYLNVAHVDEMTDESLGQVMDIVMANFLDKLDLSDAQSAASEED
jgi:hypothetical protein